MLLTLPATAADTWPTRPMRLIVPAAPGGAVDIVARIASDAFAGTLHKPVIVDNRVGADGAIGLESAAKASPDGHTLAMTSDSVTVLPLVHRGIAFDPQTSFAAIALAATQPRVVAVHPSIAAASFRDFVALAKARPGAIAYASGSPAHRLTAELIKKMAGIDLLHVPYKGGAPAIADLIGGHVPSAVTGLSPVLPQARAGKLRMLAVTSAKRSPMAPAVPTLDESGLTGYDVYEWIMLLAPARTPRDIVVRLNRELAEALRPTAARARLDAASLEAASGSPEDAARLVREGYARWAKLAKELDLRFD